MLLVHIDPLHLLAQNIHCRFCPDCDLLIVHQDELEAQLVIHVSEHFPADVGNDYLVLGTMERAAWNENRRNPKPLPEILDACRRFSGGAHDQGEAGRLVSKRRGLTMSISHTNRKGVTFYLGRGVTKTGKPRYLFAREPDKGSPYWLITEPH